MVPCGRVEVGEDAPDLFVVGAPAAVETDAARAAVEQRCTEMALQHADAVGDGGQCDLKFLGGAYEVLVPCGSVEEAEAIERWQGVPSIYSSASPMGRKSALRREIPWILRGFQGRLSC